MTEETLEKEVCPFCHEKELILSEEERDIPYFGKVFLFSMSCGSCHYYKSDVETSEKSDPAKLTFTVENVEDLKVRVVKSAEATIKLGVKLSVRPGPASIGFITNVEGIINRFYRIVEQERNNADDADARKKAKNLLKKLRKVKDGEDKIKLVIEDPTGNSAIISEKTVVKKLKK